MYNRLGWMRHLGHCLRRWCQLGTEWRHSVKEIWLVEGIQYLICSTWITYIVLEAKDRVGILLICHHPVTQWIPAKASGADLGSVEDSQTYCLG